MLFAEQGYFLALDLGGTNFRVLLVRLKGQEAIMQNKIFAISEKLMKGSGTDVRVEYKSQTIRNIFKMYLNQLDGGSNIST